MVTSTKLTRATTPRKPANASNFAKKSAKANASILSFFQKTPKPEDSLFVGSITAPLADNNDDIYTHDSQDRYNEVESPNKRRRLSEEQKTSESVQDALDTTKTENIVKTENKTQPPIVKPRAKNPFVMDSDSEDDDDGVDEMKQLTHRTAPSKSAVEETPSAVVDDPSGDAENCDPPNIKVATPTPRRRSSADLQPGEPGEFAEFEDLDLDTFEGEEMREMRYMREQARLEAEEGEGFPIEEIGDDSMNNEAMVESCPICSGSLAGVSADEATRHVNGCLDGNPIPLPEQVVATPSIPPEVEASEISKRFARAAVPRPAQANPFEMTPTEKGSKSAFSKLMSNNAEVAAWATAAAAEHTERGRPAYERTCPFYKIMPGFSICVDAFRYGAVEGCSAYFLSHFHSDHYIGLTASWKHGPIYCSKVTGSLVKQQLRTAAKFVVELEFDKHYDIPGTDGASVTMIPANHCPGSSLFLFEKYVGAGPNKRTKRILHCGDFRACPEHIGHPLLKPDVQDMVSGKVRQQKIDLCYLDTTYLNPRYSFPPQDDVIRACAEMCSSISGDPNCKDDAWQSEKASGSVSVSKYFQTDKPTKIEDKVESKGKSKHRLLVICGTYSIGKERICVAIAKALGSKIFAPPRKIKIIKQLDDPELISLLTSDPIEAQVHMQMLMEIRAETLQEYLDSYRPHFSRIVGFRPSGWTYRPTNGKPMGQNTPPGSVPIQQILHDKAWRARFTANDLTAQRGSTKEAVCFGVPYSEHSSFRELALFVMSLRIEKIIPTVNIGSEQSRNRMKGWIDKWTMERRKGGLVRPLIEGLDGDPDGKAKLWDGKTTSGGEVWWY